MSVFFTVNNQQVECSIIECKSDSVCLMLNGKEYHLSGQRLVDGGFVLDQQQGNNRWQRITGYGVAAGKAGYKIQLGQLEAVIQESQTQSQLTPTEIQLSPVAPMPGTVRKIMVEAGQTVSIDQPLIVLEAMKLQLTLSAGGEATVAEILVEEGQMVDEGAQLVALFPVKGEKENR